MSALTDGHRPFLLRSPVVYVHTDIPVGLTIADWQRERAAEVPARPAANNLLGNALRRVLRRAN